ncbi:DUF1007 family protein (plasmid) [Thioclava litoralis]|uniref:DUF1007 family protein n=1 Tax=Thioclava litoralis TaxID=3076557 RepID=A0ABZ1E371_9RHOB|nr:DUF1007 family protein [Thioclava sp. FTW29]
MRRAALIALVLGGLGLSPPEASAHPEDEIVAQLALVMNGPNVTEIDETWLFSAQTSQWLVQSLNQPQQGPLSPDALNQLVAIVRENTAPSLFYTRLLDGAQEPPPPAVSDFAAELTASGSLRFSFVLRPVQPLDARTLRLVLSDPDALMDLRPAPDTPLRLTGDGASACVPILDRNAPSPFDTPDPASLIARLLCRE